MFLKRSAPKLLSELRSTLASRSLSSGIMGGGGPAGFLTSSNMVLALLFPGTPSSPPRSRRNHPLERLDRLPSVMMLKLLRLCGLPSMLLLPLASPPTAAPSPSVYDALRRPRLKSRRMLPGRFEEVGETGEMGESAGRFVPVLAVEPGEVEVSLAAVPLACPLVVGAAVPFRFAAASADGVSDRGGSSSTGDGSGGGMLVPSVRDPNLNSRTGSSNRFEAGWDAGVAPLLCVLDGMAG